MVMKQTSLTKSFTNIGITDQFTWKISTLADYEKGFFEGSNPQDQFICFADPSNYSNAPGWMLRNLLVLLQQKWGLRKAQILCYRDVPSKSDSGRSLVVTMQLDIPSDAKGPQGTLTSAEMPKVTGWERNTAGKLSGRLADLTAYMDPQR